MIAAAKSPSASRLALLVVSNGLDLFVYLLPICIERERVKRIGGLRGWTKRNARAKRPTGLLWESSGSERQHACETKIAIGRARDGACFRFSREKGTKRVLCFESVEATTHDSPVNE